MTLPPVTVVVASYGKLATLRACLDAVLSTDYPDLDLLVVDSGSADGTLQLLARHYPRVRVELLPGASLPAALNRGFVRAGARDVVRVHGDVAPQGCDWLRKLAAAACALPKAGVVGVKLVHANGRIQSLGRDLVTGLGFGHQNTDRRAFEFDAGEGGAPFEVDGVRGACAYYRRALLERVQLDEAYAPAHGDDDDFCIAARYHGFKVFVAPDVTAVHFTPHRSRMTQFSGMAIAPELDAALSCADDARRRSFAYFAAKWGFDPQGPDLHEIRRRYGDTEICWRIGAGLRYAVRDAQPAVDVAFVTCNSAKLLPRMLEALAATRWPALRAYAVDNGSRDDTLAILTRAARELPFPLHVHELPINTGVVPAMNLAFSLGNAPLVARLDDDAIVPPDWLERLVPRFAQRPYAGVIVPRVLHGYDGEHLQAQPLRSWPRPLPAEPDAGGRAYADVLLRAATLCGCCNLYRRDALARVGLLDVRYAPTQYDDTDHHIALGHAGFEVLHDGFVAVRHFISQGRSQTHAAMSSSLANQQKLLGKWGADAQLRLDRGIDLSREGRVLPKDGDTAAFWRAQPPPLPPQATPRPEDLATARQLRARSEGFAADGAFVAQGHALLAAGERALAEGRLDVCSASLWGLIDVFPHWPQVWSLQSRRAAAEGDQATARRALALVRALQSDAVDVAPTSPRRVRTACARTVREAVLLPAGRGPSERSQLAELLALAEGMPTFAGFGHDFAGLRRVLVLDLGDPVGLLDMVKAVRLAAPDAHIELWPWLGVADVAAWGSQVVPSIFKQARDPSELAALLAAAAQGRLDIGGSTARRFDPPEPDWLLRYQREVLGNVDSLRLAHSGELAPLRARFGELPPQVLAGWPAPALGELQPEAFRRAHGLGDYVLLPGPVTPVNNQLLALHALRELPCVVTGPYPDADYAALCRDLAGPRAMFLPELELAELSQAVRASRCVVSLSFAARVTPALIAARTLGVPVVSASQLDVFPRAVDPCDVPGVGAAVARALALAFVAN